MKTKPGNQFLHNFSAQFLRKSFLSAAALTLGTAVDAATYTYTGTTGTVNWSTGTNWTGGAPVSNLDTILNYTSTLAASAAVVSNNDIASPPFKLNQLSFTNVGPGTGTAPTLALTGSQLEFITNSSSATPTLTFNTTGTVKPVIDIQNNLLLTNNLGITATTDGKLSGAITGGGSLTKAGGGVLTLSSGNSYSGGTIINAGTIKMGNAAALGGNSSTFSVSSNAVLDMNGTTMSGTTYAGTINGSGSGSSGALINSGSTSATYLGTLTLGSDATIGTTGATGASLILGSGNGITGNFALTVNTVSNAQVQVFGNISTASVTKIGINTLRLESANTFAGGLFINNGSVVAKNVKALGGSNGDGAVNLGDTTGTNNATLSLGIDGTFNNPVTVRAGSSGTATINNFGINSGNIILAGNVTLNKALTLQSLGLSSGGIAARPFTVSGNISTGSGTTNLTVVGPGITVLSGTNNYNGTTSLTANNNSGALQFQNKSSLYNGTTGSWTSANLLAASGTVMVFNVGGGTEFTTGNIDTISATTGIASGASIGIDTTSNSGTLSYNMSSLPSGRGIGKFGTGTWSYGGTTLASNAPIYIDNGTLAITTDYTTAGKVGAIKFGGVYGSINAGTLDLSTASVTATSLNVQTNNSTTANTLTIGSTKTLALTDMTVGIDGNAGTNTTTSALVVNGAGTLTVTNQATIGRSSGTNTTKNTANLTFGGGVSGAGSATFSAGLILASNSATGATGTSAATLTIGGNGSDPFSVTSGAITMAATSGSGAAGNTATASLILNAGGTLTMTGDIANGTVGTGTSSSTVTLSGGTLDMGGKNLGTAGNLINNLNFQSGTLKNVGTINSTAGVTKSTTGTLILSGSNGFTGKTVVQDGTVSFSVGNASATAAQQLGKNTDLDLGVASTSSGTLLYTGGTDTLAKNINALGNGNNTIQNSGGGTLTLSGTLAKNGTKLVLKNTISGSQIIVSNAITGTSANSDLIISGGTTTLNAANTYNGPTSVIGAGTLALGINNAIPSNSAVTLGDATTTGTMNMGAFTNTIGSLSYGAGGGILKMAANQTGSAQLAASGAVAFGSSNTIDLTGMGTSAGLYKLVSGSSLSGSFGTVTGLDSAYTLKYGTVNANELDAQHKATISLALGSNAASVHVGSQTVNLSIGNTAPSGSADLSYTLGGVSGSGTRVAGAGSSAATGTYTAVAGPNSFNITASDAAATNSPQTVAFTQTGYNLAAAATSQTVNVGSFRVGYAKPTGITLANTAPANATYTETLSSNGFSGTTSNFTATGSVSGIAGGGTGSGSLFVGVGAGLGAGPQSGTTTLALNSDAVNTSGLGTTPLTAQTITINATGYNPASAASSQTVTLNTRPGVSVSTSLSLTNTGSTGAPYQETLGSTGFSSTTSGYTTGGWITGLAGGASGSGTLSVGVSGFTVPTPGAYTGATTSLSLQTEEVNSSGLGNQGIASQTVNINVNVYDYATATFSQSGGDGTLTGGGTSYTLDFGTGLLLNHTYTATINLANGLFNAYKDSLAGAYGTVGGPFSETANNFASLTSGGTDSFTISFNTGSTGNFSDTLTFDGTSLNGALGNSPLSRINIGIAANAVPEPDVSTLIGGIGMLLLLRRRR